MRAVVLALFGALLAPEVHAEVPPPGAPIVLTSDNIAWTRSLIDANGTGHVVVVSGKPRILAHFTVRPDGETTHEVIDPKPPDEAPSLVMGGDGHLRVAIGGQVYLRDEAGWRRLADAPPCSELARAGDTIGCAFLAKNTTPGQHGKWSFGIIPVFGGMGGGLLPYLWYTKNHTLFVAREVSPGQWSTLPLTGPADLPNASSSFALAGTPDGTLHVLYSLSDTTRLETRTRDSADLYVQLDGKSPATAAPATGDGSNSVEQAGTRIVDYVPDGSPGRPCLLADGVDNEVLLLVGGRSPYLHHPGEPAARHKEYAGLPCHEHWGIAIDADHALHVVTPLAPARASAWHGVDYFDLCYHRGRPGQWATPVAVGRMSPKSRGASISSDGHGRALVTWTRPDDSLVARWLDHSPGAGVDGVDAEAQQRCAAHQLGPMFDNAPALALPEGETAKATFEPVEWYGTANGNWAMAKLATSGKLPVGTVTVTGEALYFTANNVANATKVEPKEVRLPLADIASVKRETFGMNQWVSIRRRDGVFQCFKVLGTQGTKGARVNTTGVAQAVDYLQGAIGAQAAH